MDTLKYIYLFSSEHFKAIFSRHSLNWVWEDDGRSQESSRLPPRNQEWPLIFLKWLAEDMEEKDYLRPFKESWFLPVYGVIWVEEDNRFIQESSRLLSRVLKVPLISLNDMQKIRKRRTISRLENHQWEAKVWDIWSVLKNKVSLSYWKTFVQN